MGGSPYTKLCGSKPTARAERYFLELASRLRDTGVLRASCVLELEKWLIRYGAHEHGGKPPEQAKIGPNSRPTFLARIRQSAIKGFLGLRQAPPYCCKNSKEPFCRLCKVDAQKEVDEQYCVISVKTKILDRASNAMNASNEGFVGGHELGHLHSMMPELRVGTFSEPGPNTLALYREEMAASRVGRNLVRVTKAEIHSLRDLRNRFIPYLWCLSLAMAFEIWFSIVMIVLALLVGVFLLAPAVLLFGKYAWLLLASAVFALVILFGLVEWWIRKKR